MANEEDLKKKEGEGGDEDDKKVVKVAQKTLDAILEKVESLEAQKEKDAKTISKLLAVADRGRLANYENQHEAGELIRRANLSTWDGVEVIGWRTIKNDVRFTDNGGIVAEQTLEIFTLNRKDITKPGTHTMDQIAFARNSGKVDAEIIEIAKQKNGRELYTLRLEDGLEVKLDIAFLN